MHLNGRWRIMEMDLWDQEAIDLVAPGFIEFGDDGTGEFGFIAVRGWMDCRPGERGGPASVEFSWQGDDEGDEVSGRGWAVLSAAALVAGAVDWRGGKAARRPAWRPRRRVARLGLNELK